ncbi:MAG: hypothetical protein ACREUQ_13940 [Burkholderiales bacterium]
MTQKTSIKQRETSVTATPLTFNGGIVQQQPPVASRRAREVRELPLDEHMEMLRTETIDDEQAKILADGFEVLVTVLRALASPSH